MGNKPNITFNEFCHKICDRLYEPKLPKDKQCTGYYQLLKMVDEDIKPASIKEIKDWENDSSKIYETPDIKYLRFLHPLLRPFVIENWNQIRLMKRDNFIKRK